MKSLSDNFSIFVPIVIFMVLLGLASCYETNFSANSTERTAESIEFDKTIEELKETNKRMEELLFDIRLRNHMARLESCEYQCQLCLEERE